MPEHLWLLVLVSVIDRAGIPVAFLTGLTLLVTNNANPSCFLILCIAAGLLGDMLMYVVGRFWMDLQKAKKSIFYPSSIFASIDKLASHADTHTFLWIFSSRILQHVNHLIPIAAGIRKYSAGKAFLAAMAGNILWFLLFYYLFSLYSESIVNYSKFYATISIGLTVLFVFIFYCVNRIMKKKTGPV